MKILLGGGVEYKLLEEVCEFRRGRSITKKNVKAGNIPVIGGGQKPSYYHDSPNRVGETIAVSSSGAYAGFVSYWDIPIFLSDSFSVNPKLDLLVPKFVFYFLKNIQEKIHHTKKGAGVAHVYGSDLASFKIPIPPMPIQKEIVKILDTFEALINDISNGLPAEIEARRKQYHYYRELLLDFEELGGVAL